MGGVLMPFFLMIIFLECPFSTSLTPSSPAGLFRRVKCSRKCKNLLNGFSLFFPCMSATTAIVSDGRNTEKIVVGLVERVTIVGKKKNTFIARIDTGATKSSIDTQLAGDLGLGPIISSRLVKSVHGNSVRPVIEAAVTLAGKQVKAEFSLANRSHMKYPVLIGQNILKEGFLIDPSHPLPE